MVMMLQQTHILLSHNQLFPYQGHYYPTIEISESRINLWEPSPDETYLNTSD